MIVVAVLDARLAWSQNIPTAIWWGALLICLASQLFVLWAMVTNRFFTTTVCIQEERGHQVVDTGPYGLVRHPGYTGSVVYTLLIPLVLGSYWTYIPATVTVILLVARTALEDRILQEEPPGYKEYAKNVPHRLFPGVW